MCVRVCVRVCECVCTRERTGEEKRISSTGFTTRSVMYLSAFLLTMCWFFSICFSVPLQTSNMVLVWIRTMQYPVHFTGSRGYDGLSGKKKKKKEQARVHPKFIPSFCIKRKQKIHIEGKKDVVSIVFFVFLCFILWTSSQRIFFRFFFES